MVTQGFLEDEMDFLKREGDEHLLRAAQYHEIFLNSKNEVDTIKEFLKISEEKLKCLKSNTSIAEELKDNNNSSAQNNPTVFRDDCSCNARFNRFLKDWKHVCPPADTRPSQPPENPFAKGYVDTAEARSPVFSSPDKKKAKLESSPNNLMVDRILESTNDRIDGRKADFSHDNPVANDKHESTSQDIVMQPTSQSTVIAPLTQASNNSSQITNIIAESIPFSNNLSNSSQSQGVPNHKETTKTALSDSKVLMITDTSELESDKPKSLPNNFPDGDNPLAGDAPQINPGYFMQWKRKC
jgi:hypothetical protein